jgi:hypothetical protein
MAVSDQLHAPAALPPRSRHPLDRRLGGPQSRSGHGNRMKTLCRCWEKNPGRPGPSLLTALTELLQLRHLETQQFITRYVSLLSSLDYGLIRTL